MPALFLDALAAQLVRQVDALVGFDFVSDEEGGAAIYPATGKDFSHCDSGEGRTMNTIKAIVDSKVLDE